MLRYRSSLWVCLSFLGLFIPLASGSAEAQTRLGVQGGMSIDPDQVFFGGHVLTTPLVDRLRFRPGVDIGFGEDVTLVAFNFDFVYSFPSRQAWNLFAGAGPSMNIAKFDNDSNFGSGFNALVGAQHRGGLFFEMKVGMVDSPNFKFGVGYTFR